MTGSRDARCEGRFAGWADGAREAFGAPGMVLCATFLGFGSLCRESGFSVDQSVASTFSGWALPGQIAMVELQAAGAPLYALALAVALANVRLMPMVTALVPVLSPPGHRLAAWKLYLAAHLIAVTGWAGAMQRGPSLPPRARLGYFLGLAGVLWFLTMAATAIGFLAATAAPRPLALALVYLNPLYFLIVFLRDLGQPLRARALALGAVAGPPAHMIDPELGLVWAGLAAGTVAFLTARWASPAPEDKPGTR